ncbi:Ankyrin repeat and MYND domain-containing protein 2 [Cichlidogyrus casuarinus]|uniref:Ankyrin repeat and MYND domain-containing protein 2 n=1 Tax=Cichlidogyrus casuarinus TaxID=1844966 RepID=A0ABD2PZ33_9PLAT
MKIDEEEFLRKSLSSFPYPESTLWRQLVTSCAKVDPLTSEIPIRQTILSMLNCKNTGSDKFCAACGETGTGASEKSVEALSQCTACKNVSYCDTTCQKIHWPLHKKYCTLWQN